MENTETGLFDIKILTEVGFMGFMLLLVLQFVNFIIIDDGMLIFYELFIVAIQYIHVFGPWTIFGIYGGLIRRSTSARQQAVITVVSAIAIFIVSYIVFSQYGAIIIFQPGVPSLGILTFRFLLQLLIGLVLGLVINNIIRDNMRSRQMKDEFKRRQSIQDMN